MRDIEKTGNRKCWHLRSTQGDMTEIGPEGKGKLTRNQAMSLSQYRWEACLDGYHFEPCPGQAHEIIASGGDQDNCMVCAPRWGVIMVPDKEGV